MGLFGFGKKKKKEEPKTSLQDFMKYLESEPDEDRLNIIMNMSFEPEKELRKKLSFLNDADFKAFQSFLRDARKSVENSPEVQAIRNALNND